MFHWSQTYIVRLQNSIMILVSQGMQGSGKCSNFWCEAIGGWTCCTMLGSTARPATCAYEPRLRNGGLWWAPTAVHSWTPLRCHKWVQCNYGCGGLSDQGSALHPYSHHHYSPGLHPIVPSACVEAPWPPKIDNLWSGITVHHWVHVQVVSPLGYQGISIHSLSPPVRWSN
jgi:hypothetical protein